MRCGYRFIRNTQAGDYLDDLLVSAVCAILSIRFILHVTGYPTVGGEHLHVAHLLWGGLLMLVAIALLLSFLSRTTVRLAAIVGGIGFGAFIDEIGKFVTHDNDYFYEPAAAIMYATCVLFYLTGRLVLSRRDYSATEYLVNALRETEELAVEDLDLEEHERAMRHLERSDPLHPLTPALRAIVAGARLSPLRQPGRAMRFRRWVARMHRRVVGLQVFPTVLILFFVAQLAVKLGYAFTLAFLWGVDERVILEGRLMSHLAGRVHDLSFAHTAKIFMGFVEGIFILLGIVRMRRSRVEAFRLFRTSILVNIFLTQVFVFAGQQFGALTGLLFNLLVLGALNYLIEREGA
ncbi:hypothetical protein JXA88_18695 [Candidatus Fermentibacteria bacterium]|nr:hypothetical protein [Candidatus Fermentibacteria bacterium]